MVCIGSAVLKKGKNFNEKFRQPKSPGRLTNSEIRKYLSTYGWEIDDEYFDYGLPEIFASPIDRLEKGLYQKTGFTGNIVYEGLSPGCQKGKAESYIGNGAKFEGRTVKFDTYFNEVLYQAWKKGIIKWDGNELFDLSKLRINASINRNSKQNRKVKSELREIIEFENRSRNSLPDWEICASI